MEVTMEDAFLLLSSKFIPLLRVCPKYRRVFMSPVFRKGVGILNAVIVRI